MKKLALSSLVALFAVSAASAAVIDSSYVGAHVKYGFSSTEDTVKDASVKVKKDVDDSVFGGGVAVGARFFGVVRGELEYAINSTAKETSLVLGDNIKGELMTQSVLANAYYDFDIKQLKNFKPYVGAGLGLGINSLKVEASDGYKLGDDTTVGFAWQVGAGVAYNLCNHLTLDLGYRYMNYASTKFTYTTVDLDKEKHDFDTYSHEIRFGARYAF
jgi:opacity protein-like surface antigen